MLKLFQVNVVTNWGSTGHIAEDIGKVAMSHGWESYIAYGRGMNAHSESKLIRIGSSFDFYEHVLESMLFDNHGLASQQSTRSFVRQIEDIKPDIIHLHNIHGYYLNYKIFFEAISRLDIPVVWTLHDCWSFTGHCAYFSANDCQKWKTGCKICNWKTEYPKSFLLNRSNRNYQQKKMAFTSVKTMQLVTVSDWLGSMVRGSFLGKYPIRTIYNGIDTDIFKCNSNMDGIKIKYGLKAKNTLIGVATTWNERKNLKDYLCLRTLLPEDTYNIILVGLSKGQCQELPKGIVGLQRTNSVGELVDIYNVANVVLNLSKEETFGMTTAEGFACGTPCVGYDITATPELITSETGKVVKVGDVEGVAKAVSEICNKGKSFYLKNCRERALKFFDKKRRYEDYLVLYEKLIQNKR